MDPISQPRRPAQRAHSDQSHTSTFLQQCELCGCRRSAGSVLASRPGPDAPILWVCDDCQHKLARCVDDKGALGG